MTFLSSGCNGCPIPSDRLPLIFLPSVCLLWPLPSAILTSLVYPDFSNHKPRQSLRSPGSLVSLGQLPNLAVRKNTDLRVKQQNLIFSQFWKVVVWDQDVHRSSFSWGCLVAVQMTVFSGCLLSVIFTLVCLCEHLLFVKRTHCPSFLFLFFFLLRSQIFITVWLTEVDLCEVWGQPGLHS